MYIAHELLNVLFILMKARILLSEIHQQFFHQWVSIYKLEYLTLLKTCTSMVQHLAIVNYQVHNLKPTLPKILYLVVYNYPESILTPIHLSQSSYSTT